MGDVSNFPLNGFEWVEDPSQFKEDFIKNYVENSDMGYFLEVDVEYWKNLFSLRRDLPFLPERKKIENVISLFVTFIIHIRALKQALNHGLILRKVHRILQFNQKAWLKPYIDMNILTWTLN